MIQASSLRSYPSVIAPIRGDWRESSDGVQFEYKNKRVGVGHLVKDEQLNGTKKINLEVQDLQFEQLLISAAIHAKAEGIINLDCGFPRQTFLSNREGLAGYKGKRFEFVTPQGPKSFIINRLWPIFEPVGHGKGIRYSLGIEDRPVIAPSIGFGTAECIVISANGRPRMETVFGEKLGIRLAALRLKEKLLSLGFRPADHEMNDSFYDSLLIEGYAMSSRFKARIRDGIMSGERLKEIVDQSLLEYAEEDLAPPLFQYLEEKNPGGDAIFAPTGGGSLYDPVKNFLLSSARKLGLETISVEKELALKSAAIGYTVAALSDPDFSKNTLIADFGNSHTVFAWTV